MVTAILSFIFSCVSLFAFWWLSIPGVLLGIIAITKAEDDNIQRGFGIAGVVVGAVALIILAIVVSLAGIGASMM